MQMQLEIQLKSMIKSMKDTVLPAIDPNNKLAVEQGNLIFGMLSLISQRMGLGYRYNRDELERTLGFTARLQQQTNGGPETQAALQELARTASHGAEVLDRARAEPSELVDAVKSLRADLSAVIKAVFVDGEPASKQAARESVLANAKEQLLRERSWLIMQNWEPNPEEIPPVESLIGKVR